MKDSMILVRRENINCSTISVDEFVRMIFSDVIEAEEKYNTLYVPEYIESIINRFEHIVRCCKTQATNFAIKKWKTEKKRNIYIEQEINKAKAKYNFNPFYYHLSFFDMDLEPERNCGSYGIEINKMSFDSLRSLFEKIKNNYYFKNALGWELEYRSSRPQIKLILPVSIQNEYDNAKKNIANAINEFYNGCTYWGD